MKFILTSTSPLKKEITLSIIQKKFPEIKDIYCFDTKDAKTANQPINDGILTCACKRILHVEENLDKNFFPEYVIISIENGLLIENQNSNLLISDVCLVVLHTNSGYHISHQSFPIKISSEIYHEAVSRSNPNYELKHLGLEMTLGSIIHERYPEIPANNWMADLRFGGLNRKDQIGEPLEKCLSDFESNILNNELLCKNLLYFDNFPKPGVRFVDLSKILANPNLLNLLIQTCTHKLKKTVFGKNLGPIHKIIGLDARGFIYGPLLAYTMNCGFVMARKKGKLPSSALAIQYGTEYSFDSIEIMENMIQPGDKVIIVDDLVATGGSLEAAKKLVQGVGGEVVAYLCITQVKELAQQAHEKLGNIPLIVIINN